MGRNVGKRACWAGDNRHVYSKYYTPSTKKERDGQAWLEEKQKRRGVSNCHGIALRRRRRRPTQSSAGNKQLGWISQQKKKGKKTQAASVRPGRRLLIIPHPPTICAPHTRLDLRIGWEKKTKQKQLLPSHSRRKCWSHTSSTVDCLDQRKSGRQEIPVAFISFVCCV